MTEEGLEEMEMNGLNFEIGNFIKQIDKHKKHSGIIKLY